MEDPKDTTKKESNNDQLSAFKEAEVNLSSTPSKLKKPKEFNSDITKNYMKLSHFCVITFGFIIFLVGFFIFFIGHHPDGLIFEITNKKRMVLAVFLSTVGGLALLYGFRVRPLLGATLGLLLGAGLCYLPIHFKDSYKKERDLIHFVRSGRSITPPLSAKTASVKQKETPLTEDEFFKKNINYATFLELKEQDPDHHTIGLLIINLPTQHHQDILDFYTSTLNNLEYGKQAKVHLLSTQSPIATEPAALLVIQHQFDNNETVEDYYRYLSPSNRPTELQGISYLTISPQVIEPYRPDDLANPVQQASLLLRQLLNLDRKTQRLTLSKIRDLDRLVLAPDYLDKLNSLLKSRDLDFKVETAITIHHWLNLLKNSPKLEHRLRERIEFIKNTLLTEMTTQMKQKKVIPNEILEFFTTFPTPGSEKLMFYIWAASPLPNEKNMITAGSLAVKSIVPHLKELSDIQLLSACSILEQSGTIDEILMLEEVLRNQTNEKICTSLRSTIDAIKNRH